MNFDLLDTYLTNQLSGLKINQFNHSFSSTIALANHYVKKNENLNALRTKNQLDFFYKELTFGFINSQTPSTSKKLGKSIVQDKLETEKYLKRNHVNCTVSQALSLNDYQEGLEVVTKSTQMMVLKPINLNRGDGISLNVDSTNFQFAWEQAKIAFESRKRKFKVLLQPMVDGVEARFLVIEGNLNSVIMRVPANVIGDGKQSIKELIAEKNSSRQLNPHLKNLPIKVNNIARFNLKRKGYTMDSILKPDEIVYLHHSSNVSLGGDSYEISHLIGSNLKELSEAAVRAVPDIETVGVDILFTSFNDKNAIVLELNSSSNLRMHHYPWKGTPKTPVFDLIDSMLIKFIAEHKS